MKQLLSSLRPKQWIKNLFIFLPLIFGKQLFVFPNNLKSLGAFLLFSISAGVVYLLNDIMDIEKDESHPIKRLRPIVSGKLSLRHAQIAAFVLGILTIILSYKLNLYFCWVIFAYLIFNFIYTKVLKEVVIIDVFCIAVFFLLRIIAGSIIAEVELSHWIIIMTVLLALFLGFNKRRQELKLLEGKATIHRPVLAKYNAYFIDQMIAVVTSSIVVVYMLYTVDAWTVSQIGSKHLMYSIPFVYYGIFHYLFLVHIVRRDADPTRILLSDSKMQLNLIFWIIVCVLVIYL